MHKNGLLIFLIISFGIAVPLFYISTKQTSSVLITLLFLLGSYAPALGAWLALSITDPQQKPHFTQRIRRGTQSKWIWISILVPSLVWFTTYLMSLLLNKTDSASWLLGFAMPLVFLVNYGEEIGWRGYALPFLLQRFPPMTSSLLLGGIWVLFHVPLYLAKPVFGLLASIIIILISVILTWMYTNTHSILPGTLFHAVFDTWTQVFAGVEHAEYILAIVIVLLFAVVVWMIKKFGRKISVETVSLP